MRNSFLALPLAVASLAAAQPYDFSDATALLNAELPNLNGHVAVIVRQNGVELYRFQFGDIGYGTKTRLASFTKTLSAAVVLSLVDDGRLRLSDRLGTTLNTFENNGLGNATILDCFGMRHGITTPISYEIDSRYTLAQSVALIGTTGTQSFTPGTFLDYDGAGMQAVGRIAEIRGLRNWATLARTRVFDLCAMPDADYLQFDPNPAIAGGARSSANETINFAQMVIDQGVFNSARVLSNESIERLFTNSTQNLPTVHTPWPATHPDYPYGHQPDYGFGDWIFAQNPSSQHVEEIVGAGAWGSFIWMDRRRALTAVLITDVPAGSQQGIDGALGLFAIARRETEAAQCSGLSAQPGVLRTDLAWSIAPGSTSTRIYGAHAPIRDIFDVRAATLVADTAASSLSATPFPYYAALAVFPQLANTALVPGSNSLESAVHCPADVNTDGGIDGDDVQIFFASWDASDIAADINKDGGVDGDDVIDFFARWDAGC